jgi:uncharacterized Tic20 family protein
MGKYLREDYDEDDDVRQRRSRDDYDEDDDVRQRRSRDDYDEDDDVRQRRSRDDYDEDDDVRVQRSRPVKKVKKKKKKSRPEGALTAEERQWAMFSHLSALSGFIIPLGNIIGPMVIWMMKKESSDYVDHHGKEALNFQITMLIWSVICIFTIIGIIALPVVSIFALVMPIIAGLKANEGEEYVYPATWRFIS